MNGQREYQIRIVDDYGEEEVFNFSDKDEATKQYREIHQKRMKEDADNSYQIELIEVLEQDTIQPMNSSDDL